MSNTQRIPEKKSRSKLRRGHGPDFFALNQYKDYIIYNELAKIEPVPAFKKVLEQLVHQEFDDYQFWSQFSSRKKYRISPVTILFYKVLRKVAGLTFTAKFLERHEKTMQVHYTRYIETVEEEWLREKMHEILAREKEHEEALIAQVKEGQVQFMSSIVLGLNDSLIELTGALVGFTFSLTSAKIVALTGFITGLAASLSMASSAYLQAQYEPSKDPFKASAYTGISYFFVVVLLITPFLVFQTPIIALMNTFIAASLIVAVISAYTAILFERSFIRQFIQMFGLSIGVAILVFVLSKAFQAITGATL